MDKNILNNISINLANVDKGQEWGGGVESDLYKFVVDKCCFFKPLPK